MISILNLRWDDWNRAHIARHQVAPEEVEDVCYGDPMVEHGYKGRYRLVGSTHAGRMLAVVLAPEEAGVYYPVTARPASRRERRRYQEAMGEETP